MKIRKGFAGVSMLFLLFVTMGLLSCRQTQAVTEPIVSSDAGMAPDFNLPDLSGNNYSLSKASKGKVVILDFWATWCPPCRMEIPHFQDLYEKYKDQGLEVVGVALDQGGASIVKPFIDSNGVTYKVVIGNQQVAGAYGGIRGIPTTFIIDRNGKIVDKAVGYKDKAFFENKIKDLL